MYSLLPLIPLIVSFSIGTLCLATSLFKPLEKFSRKFARILLLLGISINLITVLFMLSDFTVNKALEIPELSLRVDSANIAAIFSVTLIFLLISVYNLKAEEGGRLRSGPENFFMLLLFGCMFGLLIVNDLFGTLLFIELMVGVLAILALHNPSKLSPKASFKFLVIASLGAFFTLLGASLIFIFVGDSNLLSLANKPELKAYLMENPQLLTFAVACFIIGLGMDVGLVPFHGWVPDVFSASNIVVVGFFAAKPIALISVLYKLVAFFYRIYPSNTFILLMLGVGLISMLFGALMAYPQKNFYRMLAFCSISECGHAVFAFSLLTSSLSFVAGQYYLLSGAFVKVGMALSLGSIYFNMKTADMNSLGGLLGKMNKTALSYIICALSLVGVPPLGGFYAKWFLYNVTYKFLLDTGGVIIAILGLIFLVCISMVLFIFLICSFHRIFMGQTAKNTQRVNEVHLTMWLPTAILAAISIILGLQPNILLNLIGAA